MNARPVAEFLQFAEKTVHIGCGYLLQTQMLIVEPPDNRGRINKGVDLEMNT